MLVVFRIVVDCQVMLRAVRALLQALNMRLTRACCSPQGGWTRRCTKENQIQSLYVLPKGAMPSVKQ